MILSPIWQSNTMTEQTARETQTGDNTMTEHEMQEWLAESIDMKTSDEDTSLEMSSFEEAGIMTTNTGLVIRTPEGDEFQVTIVKSR